MGMSIGESCRLLKGISLGGMAVNQGLSAMCTNKVGQCKNLCDDSEQRLKTAQQVVNQQCGRYTTLERSGIGSRICSQDRQFGEYARQVHSKSAQCQNQADRAHAMQVNSLAQGAFSAFAQKCEDEIKTAETGFEGLDPVGNTAFDGDCRTAANANNPICVRCNADPSAPGCEGLLVNPNMNPNGIASGFGEPLGSPGFSAIDTTLPELDNPFENPEYADPMAIEAAQRNDPTMGAGNGGGAGGMGGPGMDGGLDPLPKPGNPNGQLQTDILTGERGGSYSASSMGFNGGGGFSYGREPASLAKKNLIEAHKKSGFDLKKYLPGKQGTAKLPGMARMPANIGKTTDDIFKMVSRRYRLRCMQGQFYGCPGGGQPPATRGP
ncbi:MAG: hypothetical protein R2827_12380 [Bdellovibrionales bacterium]